MTHRKPGVDPVRVHLESYAYQMGDAMLNGPLVEHARREHHGDWVRWDAGDTVGDIQDVHWMAHGRLTSEAEMLADMERDERKRAYNAVALLPGEEYCDGRVLSRDAACGKTLVHDPHSYRRERQ